PQLDLRQTLPLPAPSSAETKLPPFKASPRFPKVAGNDSSHKHSLGNIQLLIQ
ncbi:unnamed protein product, partial [Coccothraustes coccothraustes]